MLGKKWESFRAFDAVYITLSLFGSSHNANSSGLTAVTLFLLRIYKQISWRRPVCQYISSFTGLTRAVRPSDGRNWKLRCKIVSSRRFRFLSVDFHETNSILKHFVCLQSETNTRHLLYLLKIIFSFWIYILTQNTNILDFQVQFLNEVDEVFVQCFWLLQSNEMATITVICAVNQIWVFVDQLPVQRVHQVVLEASTADRNIRRHWHHVQFQFALCIAERFRIQSHRCGDWIGQIVDHQIVEQGIFREVVVQAAIVAIAVIRMGPSWEFLEDVGGQADRIVGQCGS